MTDQHGGGGGSGYVAMGAGQGGAGNASTQARQQLLNFEPARVHARKGDPYTSDQALRAIARNGSLMYYIWWGARLAATLPMRTFNDTWLWEWVEASSKQRQQRNVIARARGLMEQAGLFRRVGVFPYKGTELMHYEIDPNHKETK